MTRHTHMSVQWRRLLAGAVMVALIVTPVMAEPSGAPSLDELLDLQPSQPVKSPTAPGDAATDETKDAVESAPGGDPAVSRDMERLLSEREAGDAFEQALDEMREASEHMGEKLDPGDPTQRLQKSAISKLDQVIAAAESQQNQGSSSSSSSSSSEREADPGSQSKNGPPKGGQPSPGSPQDSSEGNPSQGQSSGSGGAPMGDRTVNAPDKNLSEQRQEWGGLPARLRDQLLEGQNEKFSPIYREMTERYYRRLAEEK